MTKEERKQYQKEYRENDKNKDKAKQYQDDYYLKTRDIRRDKRKEMNKLYREKNKEKLIEKSKEYYENNKIKESNRKKKYNKNNRDIINKRYKERCNTNPIFKFKRDIKNCISSSLRKKGYKKNNEKTEDILGCTIEQFRKYIEDQFEPWMNWDNHGKCNGTYGFGWDYDHIKQIKTAKTREEVLELNKYTNFQPLDSHINRYIKR